MMLHVYETIFYYLFKSEITKIKQFEDIFVNKSFNVTFIIIDIIYITKFYIQNSIHLLIG